MTFLARTFIIVATLVLFHATLSTYHHLSQLKALNRMADRSHLPLHIVVECLSALVIFILGVTLNAPPLKEITWSSEMSRRSIDEIDARTGFSTTDSRAKRVYEAAR